MEWLSTDCVLDTFLGMFMDTLFLGKFVDLLLDSDVYFLDARAEKKYFSYVLWKIFP